MTTITKSGTSTITPVTALTTASKEDRVAPYFLRVTGKNITPEHPVYILGTIHDWPVENYPNSVIQTIKNCALLLSEYPIYLLGDTLKNIKKLNARAHIEIQQKFETLDEFWFNAQMKLLGYTDKKQTQCIQMLKKKKALNLKNWVKELPIKSQKNIQAHLDDYGLKLHELHPMIVETILDNKRTIRNYGSGGIEKCILEHFQEQMKPVVELDDEQHTMSMFVEGFLDFMTDFDLDDTLETMQDYCRQLDTGEYSSSEEEIGCTDINEAYAKKKMRLNLDKFKMEHEGSESTKGRNRSYHPEFLDGIGQNLSTAIIQGYEHLNGKTGTIQFIESLGYTVDLAY
jgi:uncharacterized protein YbaP (TraB family)